MAKIIAERPFPELDKLRAFCEKFGGQRRFARESNLTYENLNAWICGRDRPTAERCFEVWRATNGRVHPRDLRPDLPWDAVGNFE